MNYFTIEFNCDDCGGIVEVNVKQTADSYADHLGFKIIAPDEKIDITTLPDYLIYRCTSCYKVYNLSIAQLEQRLRLDIARMALNYRRTRVFQRNKANMDVDSGLEFCGLCGGVDEGREGYCLQSLMAVCDIRRDHLNKEDNAK